MVARPFAHTIAERAAAGTSRINLCDGMGVGFRLIQKAALATSSKLKTNSTTNKNEEIMMKSKPSDDFYPNICPRWRNRFFYHVLAAKSKRGMAHSVTDEKLADLLKL